MKTTITIDTDLHKVVPVALSGEMMRAMQAISNSLENKEYAAMHQEMLLAVPSDLPGVVAHSGEPVAFVDETDGGVFSDLIMGKDGIHVKRGDLLFTHPPAQPDTAALQARITEIYDDLASHKRMFMDAVNCLADISEELDCDPGEGGAEPILEAISELKAQLAAQAGQIPVMVRAWHEAEQERLDAVVAHNAAIEVAKRYEWPGPCTDRTYQAMTVAANKAHALKAPMHEQMKEMIYAAPPAPANSVAIVRAALEATAKAVEHLATKQMVNGQWKKLAEVRHNYPKAIRAIDPQTIINAATKGQQ